MKIVICGSMSFSEKMLEVKKELESKGHECFVSDFAQQYVGKEEIERNNLVLFHKNEKNAIIEYWKKIKESDAILVLNYDRKGIKNYIGANTFLEIGFAYGFGKKIFFLNQIPDMPYLKDELIAVKPIILNGVLENIK
ncbi:MAG: hypothetical protein ABH821_02120 [archaeon]